MKKRCFPHILTTWVFISLFTSACYDPKAEGVRLYNEGMFYYNKEYYLDALRVWQQAAEAGNADAMNFLLAMEWYLKSVEAGSSAGMNNIGLLYEEGLGVAKNDSLAIVWYKKAVDAGNKDAQDNLADLEGNK